MSARLWPAIGLISGCRAAPSQNVLGSYFPSWFVCVLIALIAVVVVRRVLVALELDESLPAPIVVYMALAVAFSFAGWMTWLD